MHPNKIESGFNQATDPNAGYMQHENAVRQETDPNGCCAQGTPQTARLMTHAEEQMLEQDAKNALYRAVAQFVMEPNQVNGTMIDLCGNQYRDAWMHGRRRVMD